MPHEILTSIQIVAGVDHRLLEHTAELVSCHFNALLLPDGSEVWDYDMHTILYSHSGGQRQCSAKRAEPRQNTHWTGIYWKCWTPKNCHFCICLRYCPQHGSKLIEKDWLHIAQFKSQTLPVLQIVLHLRLSGTFKLPVLIHSRAGAGLALLLATHIEKDLPCVLSPIWKFHRAAADPHF